MACKVICPTGYKVDQSNCKCVKDRPIPTRKFSTDKRIPIKGVMKKGGNTKSKKK